MISSPMIDWPDRMISVLQRGGNCVLVTVVAAEGSTPRETGSKMLVHDEGIEGSIGGGHLEFKAIDSARAMLRAESARIELAGFALGPSLGQCCGGRVGLMLERFDAQALPWLLRWRDAAVDYVLVTNLADDGKSVVSSDGEELPRELRQHLTQFLAGRELARVVDRGDDAPVYVLERKTAPVEDLHLFGAGHVGRALVRVLRELPYRINWFDARREMFPADLPANVMANESADPRHDVAGAPSGAFFLVMTHSHAVDFDICDYVLRRGDFEFLGLIGSATKRASFVRRLRLRGHLEAAIGRLTCPIGLPAIADKAPEVIAISVAGQLLTLSQAKASGRDASPLAAAGGLKKE
jgi:xanthine dehydrogenase accessory factor